MQPIPNIKYLSTALVAAALLLPAASSCSSDDSIPGSGEHIAEKVDAYVRLTLSASNPARDTKAGNPTGGEDGDGRENGQDYENAISDINVFFYQQGTDNKNINTASNPMIVEAQYFDDVTEKSETEWTTPPRIVSGLAEGQTYNMVVIANAGQDLTADFNGKRLNYLLTGDGSKIKLSPWKFELSGNKYSQFLMSSEDGSETITISTASGKGSEEDPIVPNKNVTIERLAARIDYQSKAASFTTKKESGATFEGTVTIQKAALVNTPKTDTYGTFWIKRVSPNADGSAPTYLGDELPAPSGNPQTNYVIDTRFSEKKAGNDSIEGVYNNAFRTHGDGTAASWVKIMKEGDLVTDVTETEGYRDWLRLGYVVENTQTAAAQDSRFVTGIVFSALFEPKGLSGYDANNTKTFFEFDGKLYADMLYAMKDFEGDDKLLRPRDNEVDTWEKLREFATYKLKANDPCGWRNWLLEKSKDKTGDLVGNEAISLDFIKYLEKECGASLTYPRKINQNGKNTGKILRQFGTKVYEDGICYYTYWIKHANDGDDAQKGVMEYGIVRNNIYKVLITGVRDLGDDIPGEDEKLDITVAVKDWLMLPEEKIEI